MLVLEYVDGISLSELLAAPGGKGRRLDDDAAFHVGISVLEALAHAHGMLDDQGRSAPVVHRAVSPSNILIARDGVVKLGGFGFAKTSGGGADTTGSLTWEPAYMAPEQVSEQQLTPKVDVYAAALVLWELLTGRRGTVLPKDPLAIEGILRAVTERKPEPLATLRRDLPRELVAAVDAALSFTPAKRTITCAEMAKWMRKVIARRPGEKGARSAREGGARHDALDRSGARRSSRTAAPAATTTKPYKRERTLMGVAPPSGPSAARAARAASGAEPAGGDPPNCLRRRACVPPPDGNFAGAADGRSAESDRSRPSRDRRSIRSRHRSRQSFRWASSSERSASREVCGGLAAADLLRGAEANAAAALVRTRFDGTLEQAVADRPAESTHALAAERLARLRGSGSVSASSRSIVGSSASRPRARAAEATQNAAVLVAPPPAPDGRLQRTANLSRSPSSRHPRRHRRRTIEPLHRVRWPRSRRRRCRRRDTATSPFTRSPGYANVYVMFARYGKVEQQLAIPCGKRFVSVGVPAAGRCEPVGSRPARNSSSRAAGPSK